MYDESSCGAFRLRSQAGAKSETYIKGSKNGVVEIIL